jgi:outer membrane protein assembly factor BamB
MSRPLTAALLLAAALAPTTALAAGTRVFRQTTAKDFEDGEATASMILPTGEVVAGMKSTHAPVDAAFVWSAALAPDGKTAYFGTGDQGRLYAVPAAGGGDKPAARKLAELEAPWITSLAVRRDGTLLAGTTPGGRVFAVDPRTGASRPFAKVAAEHVWVLVHDAASGTTYAATGGSGKVFALDARGGSRLVWDSGDKHVVALAAGPDGALLAGTSEMAILYRVRPDGRAEALHDFDADEVRAIVRVPAAGGRPAATYLAVNDFDRAAEAAPAASPGAAAAPKGTKVALTTGGPAPASAGALPRPGQVKARAGVYRLEDDGNIEQVFSLPDGYLTALVFDGAGDLYASAGTQGKIYRLHPDRTFALAADMPERQALALVRTGEGFLVGTGDVGGVYRVRPAAAGEASYLSKVFDAEFPTRWGRLRFVGSESLAVETRSGHTAKPDKTWTEWRKLESVTYGGGEGEGRVASPPARYLQFRVSFPNRQASLKEALVYHQPHNQRPRVTEVYLADAPGAAAGGGLAGAAPAAGGGGASPRAHSPTLKLRWRVDNPDGDDLLYKLSFRQEGEAVWRPLGPPEPLTKPEYDWNTESVPDGRYVVRVWASDEKSNARERALDSTFVSPPFLVDNAKPQIVDLASSGGAVTGRARDDASPISHVEYTLDGQEWRPAAPSDGVFDQRSEAFSVRLPATLPKGPHIVNLRAYDAADNLGTGRLQIQIR